MNLLSAYKTVPMLYMLTRKQHCKITPLSEIAADEQLPDYTVVYGDNQRRHNQTMADNPEVRDAKRKGQALHINMLKKLIPNASHKWT